MGLNDCFDARRALDLSSLSQQVFPRVLKLREIHLSLWLAPKLERATLKQQLLTVGTRRRNDLQRHYWLVPRVHLRQVVLRNSVLHKMYDILADLVVFVKILQRP